MKKRFLFVNQHPPYGTLKAKEALDALLMASAFEQTISVLFLGDGVFQLLKNQAPQSIGSKNISANISALPIYDVNAIFVDEQDLTERGLTSDNFILPVKALSSAQVAQLIQQQDIVLSF